ncbi:MAG: sigma 54-interacting transcriptional regulator [Burkholderiaceae bacterium]
MTTPITAPCNALWLDPFQPAGERERDCLADAGLKLLPVRTLDDLRQALKTAHVVVVRLVGDTSLLTDVKQLIQAFKPNIPVFCRTDRQAFDLGIEAMQLGACHVLAFDDFSEESWRLAQAYLAKAQAAQTALSASFGHADKAAHSANASDVASCESARCGSRNEQDAGSLASAQANSLQPKTFVFVDPLSQKLVALAQRVAQAQVTTLVTGPTGSGKEVLATVIHEASARAAGPFVSLNCGAIPEQLMEDMLFGHEKGAYTGAVREHKGIFEQAQGGTVFLDEIGELPLGLQAKLLRVLQERKVTRLGGSQEIALDFRLVAATNRDLKKAMVDREFREDLYFRISTFRLSIPALRQRPGDILPLVAHILSRHCADDDLKRLSLSAQQALLAYHWPGNVRELENVIQRALVFCMGDTIEADHLVFDDLEFQAERESPAAAAPYSFVSSFAPVNGAAGSSRAAGAVGAVGMNGLNGLNGDSGCNGHHSHDHNAAPMTPAYAEHSHTSLAHLGRDTDPRKQTQAAPDALASESAVACSAAEHHLHEPATDAPRALAEVHDISAAVFSGSDPIRLPDLVKTNEKKMILAAIEASPTRAEAARRLGISPRTLRYKMAQLKMAGAA